MDSNRKRPRITVGQQVAATMVLYSIIGLIHSVWKIQEPFQTIIQAMLWITVFIICVIAVIKDKPLIDPKEVDALQEKLVVASVGSCTCGVKTDDLDHHAKPCPYRVLMEAYDFLEPYGGPRNDRH